MEASKYSSNKIEKWLKDLSNLVNQYHELRIRKMLKYDGAALTYSSIPFEPKDEIQK